MALEKDHVMINMLGFRDGYPDIVDERLDSSARSQETLDDGIA